MQITSTEEFLRYQIGDLIVQSAALLAQIEDLKSRLAEPKASTGPTKNE